MKNVHEYKSIDLFNNPLETGVRILIILNSAFPKSYDLSTLTLLDHLVVHTEDIGGPPSLHPRLPQRGGELLVRRQTIERGLSLMRKSGLITMTHDEMGLSYQATDEAYPFVKLLSTTYITTLKIRAEWLTKFVGPFSLSEIRALAQKKLGNWNSEFHEGDNFNAEHSD